MQRMEQAQRQMQANLKKMTDPSYAPPQEAKRRQFGCQSIDLAVPGGAADGTTRWAEAGGALFFYSTGRGHRWHGPYKFPMRELKRIPARTGYLVNGKRDSWGFLTASKSNGKEGRPFGARTTDGGLTWKLVSCIGPEPAGLAIVPSTVRLDAAPSTGGQSGNSPGARMGFFELEFGPKTAREEVSRKYQYISQLYRLQERLGGVY